MSELQRDPAIKLFGKTIHLIIPSNDELHTSTLDAAGSLQLPPTHHPAISIQSSLQKKPSQEEHKEAEGCAEESIDPSTSSGPNEDPKTPIADKEISSTKNSKTKDPTEVSNSEEKTELKKPDKILPCPRCNSMDTKFCYFNNYNVSQPRHFCKNCQRYWTAGGTMRNVPVGSGRRKNKSSSAASHYRQIIVSEALQAARADAVHHQSVLSFASDAPLCESMASVLNLAENNIAEKAQNGAISEFHGQEQRNVDDFSVISSSSAASSNLTDKGENANMKKFQGYPLQVPYFPAPPWPYGLHPWNSAQYRPPMEPSTPTSFGPSGFSVPFYPPPQYWGCTVPSGPWSMPWLTSQNPFPEQYMDPSGPSSPLGKHSRDGNMLTSPNSAKEQASEGKDQGMTVLIPKTLRINDPNEAAKSSIWSTLGIKNDGRSNNSIKGGSLFKGFEEPKGDQKNQSDEKSTVLRANPAALSRSHNFHESS